MVLKRRVVHLIEKYFNPREVYFLVTEKTWNYAFYNLEKYKARDRAMMSLAYVSAGRVGEIVGGPVYYWENELEKAFKSGERHLGILRENLEVSDKFILVKGMKVVKRSKKLLEKYGQQIATRDDFAIPLQRGLYKNKFWDQLVPFGWLIMEYLESDYAPVKGKLFGFEDTRAWQIINKVTGKYPHWFRSQAEHFYGHFLLTDSVKLSKFVKIQDPKHVKHYIGYSWNEQLKDSEITMNFDWIEEETTQIKDRL